MPASRVALPRATARNAPAPSFFSSRSPKKRVRDAVRLRELLDRFAVGGHRQHVRRQRREPTRDVVAEGLCARGREIDAARARRTAAALASCAGRFASDLNAGSANAAAPAAASRLSAAARPSRVGEPDERDAERPRLVAQALANRFRGPGQSGEAAMRRRTCRP